MTKEEAGGGQAEAVLRYMRRIYAEEGRRYACRARTPEEVAAWQSAARPVLRDLLGLRRMAAQLEGYVPTVDLGAPEDLGAYTRQGGVMASEPDVSVPFWLLRPKGKGPFGLAVMPHGHSEHGLYAGVTDNAAARQRIAEEQRDVAVQAAAHGFVAIAPATRGLGCPGVPDFRGRFGGRDCRSQMVHCLLAGRTAVGERVWDVERLIDWGLELPEVDGRCLLVLGNSGGGVVTTYAAACDERVSIAAPSCSFTLLVRSDGCAHHCDCNTVPGILTFGDLHDVAGLIAPRRLLVVNGREDTLFLNADVDEAVTGLRAIYRAAGADERFAHAYGPGGHRFYGDLMWPFIEAARQAIGRAE